MVSSHLKGFQEFTRDFKGIKGSQGITRGFKLLHSNQSVTFEQGSIELFRIESQRMSVSAWLT